MNSKWGVRVGNARALAFAIAVVVFLLVWLVKR